MGDVIFIDPLTVNPLQRQIVRRLCREFLDLHFLEETTLGVAALRLLPRGAPGAACVWCAAHFTSFVQGSDGTVYALDLGARRRFPDAATYQRFAGIRPSMAETRQLDDQALTRIPEGPPLASVLAGPVLVSDLMYAYEVTDDGQLLRMPNACTAHLHGLRRDAGNAMVVLDDLDRFTVGPGLRFFGGVLGDVRTAARMIRYSSEPGRPASPICPGPGTSGPCPLDASRRAE